MNLGFRVDAARHIGTGHLQRCLALAQNFKLVGHNCIFFSREFEPYSYEKVATLGFECRIIGKGNFDRHKKTEKDWLSVTQSQDVEDFLKSLHNDVLDICIVDHYSIDESWECEVRKHLKKLVVIDDLANRKHHCDILIDQNYYKDFEGRYTHLVSESTVQLLGPRYCLLRSEFQNLRTSKNNKNNKHRKIVLVNFGGVSDINLLRIVIESLNQILKYNYIFITGQIKDIDFVELCGLAEEHIQLLKTVNNMGEIMTQCDFALGASGSTVWERFCLGLNAALIEVADNQNILLKDLSELGLVDNLGKKCDLSSNALIKFLYNLNLSSSIYSDRQKEIMRIVDGLGVVRVTEEILRDNYV